MKRTLLILAALTAVSTAALADHQAGHTKSLVLKNKDGLAIEGYDPVAYFTDNKAVKGSAKFKSTHEGAVYQFASAAHKAMFDAAPAKFAPAEGIASAADGRLADSGLSDVSPSNVI